MIEIRRCKTEVQSSSDEDFPQQTAVDQESVLSSIRHLKLEKLC